MPLPDGVEIGLAGLTGYELADGHTLYLYDPYRHIWRTADDGAHWQELIPPIPPGRTRIQAVGQADGGLVIADPTADGPAYGITATGTTFEPTDRSRLWPSPVKQLEQRESGYGLVGRGGTWTPLPFTVHPQ